MSSSHARFERILEIRNLQKSAAQAALARANRHAAEAERIAREVEARLDETARRAVRTGEMSLDELVETRVRVQRVAFQRDRAHEAVQEAHSGVTAQRSALDRASVATRQAETLVETSQRAADVAEADRERKAADELAALRASGARATPAPPGGTHPRPQGAAA